LISVTAICSAAPLISRNLPRTAPKQIINARPPNVLPTPFSMDANTANGCMPIKKPVKIETINSDKKGLIFFAVKKICTPIASSKMSSGIGLFSIDGYEDKSQNSKVLVIQAIAFEF
jgi:hypothetical protein